jgi:hypothetical protein
VVQKKEKKVKKMMMMTKIISKCSKLLCAHSISNVLIDENKDGHIHL